MPLTVPASNAKGFQQTAFQNNAFQWALSNVERSGVVRMWLAELTARMNGMLDEEETPEKTEKKPEVKVQQYKIQENSDGSVTVVDSNSKILAKVEKKNKKPLPETKVEPVREREPAKIAPYYAKRDLPAPQETAEFLISTISAQAKTDVWVASQVIELLQHAIEEAQEEEMLIETAALLLLQGEEI